MKKDRIVFFTSGDFAIDTFETLLNNGTNIVGLVTNNDAVKFHKSNIKDIAEIYRIPCYTIKTKDLGDDKFLIDWLKRIDADIFCVISFNILPQEIIKLAKKCAFGVHTSLLPFLRGFKSINRAIELNYKETGLTAFVLADKIDCGDIIANTKIEISTTDTYDTLYKKLSDLCVDFTGFAINDVLQRKNWKKYLITQPTNEKKMKYLTPKINIHTIESVDDFMDMSLCIFENNLDVEDDIQITDGSQILINKQSIWDNNYE